MADGVIVEFDTFFRVVVCRVVCCIRAPKLSWTHPFVFVEIETARYGQLAAPVDRKVNSPLQTFFFVPSFIVFVRHSSLSFAPQLQHPSVKNTLMDCFCLELLGTLGALGVGVVASLLSGESLSPFVAL